MTDTPAPVEPQPMTPAAAVDLLDHVASLVPMTRADQARVLHAVMVLRQTFTQPEAPNRQGAKRNGTKATA